MSNFPLFSLFFEIETPLAEHIFGMRIQRSEKALNSNGIIYFMSKACKFTAVHLLAIKFFRTAIPSFHHSIIPF
jgi:hypothetical protein